MKLTNKMIMNGASPLALTAIERAHGRIMRAPDHVAGDGGATDGGASDGNGNAGSEGSAGGVSGADGGASQTNAGASGDGAPANESGNAGGNDQPAGDSGTILGDAAKAGAGEGSADEPEGAEGEGEGGSDGGSESNETRLTFGEGDDAQPILGAPEAYDLTAPGEATFDKAAFDAVEGVMRDLNLSNDAAQALVNAYGEKVLPMLQERAAGEGEAIGADMRREWHDQSKERFDGKEGRPTFDEAKALSRQTFMRFGVKADDPFLSLLEDSGLGNHPDMLNFVAMVGRAIGEAPVEGANGKPEPVRLADRIYGKPIPAG